ncbi:MAG: NAD-dependent epimerase/dehydratase family protein [Casimicrobiaceae bacterium]|nr:NAD-dependent epimerase/dehydratase family protein [Casimicrobiaceae bacterium]MCX8097399.1 NAD-dependent epimerase/dehydratase family protein [Casimicrobiaceae bacterium]MDW8312032.1 NAD-dependent epimerase/dehydratase family protein [Burkholderiales bacterium]
MRIAITGTGGFIGGTLARALAAEGHTVVSISRLTGFDWERPDRKALRRVLSGCDRLIHCAARVHVRGAASREREAFVRANVDLTRQLAQEAVAAGIERLIYCSSIAVHGLAASPAPLGVHTPIAPADAYGASKWLAEKALAEAMRGQKTHGIILRPPLVYGPEAPGNMARLARAIARGWPLPLAAASTNRRSLCAIETLLSVVRWALEDPRALTPNDSPAVWYPCDPQPIATRAIIEALAQGLGVRARLLSVPPAVLHATLRALGQARLAEQLLGDLVIDSQPLERAGCRLAIDTEAALQALGTALRLTRAR